MGTKLDEAYAELCMRLGGERGSAHPGVRKLMMNQYWELPFDVLMEGMTPTIEMLGYSAGPAKMNHLCRNYLNEAEFLAVNEKLLTRITKEQSSLTARFGMAEKPGSSQGYCLQTITLNILRRPQPGVPKFTIEIYYRSTEVGKKFLSDLQFLREKVIPLLLRDCPIKPDLVRFKFNHLYYSSIFIPAFFLFVEPVKLCRHIKENDPEFWSKGFRNSLDKYLDPDHVSGYLTMMRSHLAMHQFIMPKLSKAQIRTLKRMAKK